MKNINGLIFGMLLLPTVCHADIFCKADSLSLKDFDTGLNLSGTFKDDLDDDEESVSVKTGIEVEWSKNLFLCDFPYTERTFEIYYQYEDKDIKENNKKERKIGIDAIKFEFGKDTHPIQPYLKLGYEHKKTKERTYNVSLARYETKKDSSDNSTYTVGFEIPLKGYEYCKNNQKTCDESQKKYKKLITLDAYLKNAHEDFFGDLDNREQGITFKLDVTNLISNIYK